MGVRVFALLAGAMLSVLLVAGCGGDSDTGTTSAAPLPKAEFIKRADAICAQHLEETRTKFLAYGKSVAKAGETAAEREGHIAVVAETIVAPELRQEIADIRALGVPEGDQGKVEAILVAIEGGITKVIAQPRRAVEGSGALEPAGRLARAYGFQVCGTG